MNEAHRRRALIRRRYADGHTGILHFIGGIGVPYHGCDCKSCRDVAPLIVVDASLADNVIEFRDRDPDSGDRLGRIFNLGAG